MSDLKDKKLLESIKNELFTCVVRADEHRADSTHLEEASQRPSLITSTLMWVGYSLSTDVRYSVGLIERD